MQRTALVTGCSGQDGSYLLELLLQKGYNVHGIDRVKSNIMLDNLKTVLGNKDLEIIDADLLDENRLNDIIRTLQPKEIYNLGAQSFVPMSWTNPIYTCNINSLGVLRILEAIRMYSHDSRFYQASSSEMFGKVSTIPQDEMTYHYPRSPYGCSKSFSFNITRNYRESYKLFACNGICFNHESERRGYQFVTRKISSSVAKIFHGKIEKFALGNLDSKRDWGYAPDYIRAMWMMLQHKEPDDYIVASDTMHSVREFTEIAFKEIGVNIEWSGKGVNEKGKDAKTGKVVVGVSKEFFRPAEVDVLRGNPAKLKKTLGWKPEVSFKEMIERMVKNDIQLQK